MIVSRAWPKLKWSACTNDESKSRINGGRVTLIGNELPALYFRAAPAGIVAPIVGNNFHMRDFSLSLSLSLSLFPFAKRTHRNLRDGLERLACNHVRPVIALVPLPSCRCFSKTTFKRAGDSWTHYRINLRITAETAGGSRPDRLNDNLPRQCPAKSSNIFLGNNNENKRVNSRGA